MQGQQEAPALPSPGNRERLRPCRASAQPNTRASPTACTQEADDLERERGGEGRRERGSAQKITALQRRPAPAPDEATAQALHPCRQPSQHPRPDGQPWRAPSARGFNSAFVEYAELPLTNAAHAIPGGGKARGILYILSATATAKNPPCTHFSTPLNFSPTQNPYITPLVIVLIFCFMIFRLRTRFLYVDHRTFLWISDLPAYILTGGFGKEIAVDYRTESLSYPYKE